jgi:DNA-directed RNA polymerase subunit K/omega
MAGAHALVENPRGLKHTRVACEEIDYGLIEYEFTPASSTGEEKDGKNRK